jgi:hypothetical protein
MVSEQMKFLLFKNIKIYLRNIFDTLSFSSRWVRGLFWPPIVVYTMGKVASKALQLSLEKYGLHNPIFHTHTLSQQHMDQMIEFGRSIELKSKLPRGIRQGKSLRHLGELTWERTRWKIVTLVREPVAREISDLFQNPHHFPSLKELKNDLFIEEAIAQIQALLSSFDEETDYTTCWFDKELKDVFGLDVYKEPLDPSMGYAIYQVQHADVLLLRLEDLSRCACQAFQEFLGIVDFKLLRINEASSKNYQQEYQAVLGEIAFSLDVLDIVYNSRYSKHFYSTTEIMKFKDRWSASL